MAQTDRLNYSMSGMKDVSSIINSNKVGQGTFRNCSMETSIDNIVLTVTFFETQWCICERNLFDQTVSSNAVRNKMKIN